MRVPRPDPQSRVGYSFALAAIATREWPSVKPRRSANRGVLSMIERSRALAQADLDGQRLLRGPADRRRPRGRSPRALLVRERIR